MGWWSSIFAQAKMDVIRIKDFPNGLVFRVKNGKGLLRLKYGASGDKGLLALVFDGIPLMEFHGDEYLCPTCEKFISAGYGLALSENKAIEELGEVFNAPFVSIEKSFNDLKPLFGLLPDGYYSLSDEELFPTDGQGNFFWNASGTPVFNYATCPVHDPDSFEWSTPVPKCLIPTQSPKLFNPERAEHYRTRQNTRAVAYYVEGSYLCALLDGHHKAVAAALNAAPVKTLVISEGYGISFPDKAYRMKSGIYFPNTLLHESEMSDSLAKTLALRNAGSRMSESETARYLALENSDFDHAWPPEILETAKSYYDVHALAYLEWAGDVSDARLDAVLADKTPQSQSMLCHIAHALCLTGNPRFPEFAISLCKNENYALLWHEIFKLLATVKDKQVEDFFIEYLINDERARPEITRIVDAYFAV